MSQRNVLHLRKIKSQIFDLLKCHASNIFSPSEIREIFDNCKAEWDLPKSLTFPQFCTFLINELSLTFEKCFFSRAYTRYTIGEAPLYDFLLSLVPDSYLSHFTALELHGLTEKEPDSVYLNYPQKRKTSRDSSLDQTRIDLAFRRSVRVSKNSALFRGKQVLLLNSMGHNNLGIIEMALSERSQVRVTNIERTLIDIAVRPVYSGGVSNILAAYGKARDKVSVDKLLEILRALDFAYPYHQSIGFYLERSGHSDSEVALLRSVPIKHDFYLDYQMAETDYSRDWRLHYPKGLE